MGIRVEFAGRGGDGSLLLPTGSTASNVVVVVVVVVAIAVCTLNNFKTSHVVITSYDHPYLVYFCMRTQFSSSPYYYCYHYSPVNITTTSSAAAASAVTTSSQLAFQ